MARAESPLSQPWRTDPLLVGRFHAEAQDDLQVIVHEGGPRITQVRPELIWVRVLAAEPDGSFRGALLNTPHNLQRLRRGAEVHFLPSATAPHPFLVTARYLEERPQWKRTPCAKCSFDGLFDAPSELCRAAFPQAPADQVVMSFTTFCPLCGEVRLLQRAGPPPLPPTQPARPWWKVWA